VGAEAVRCKLGAEEEEEDAAAIVAARTTAAERDGRTGEEDAEVEGEAVSWEPGGDEALLA